MWEGKRSESELGLEKMVNVVDFPSFLGWALMGFNVASSDGWRGALVAPPGHWLLVTGQWV